MTIPNLKENVKKYNIKENTKNENDISQVYNYPIYPRDMELYSDRGFAKIDIGLMVGHLWTCVIKKDNKSFYFDYFGTHSEKFISQQLQKPINYHNFKNRDLKSKLYKKYCFYFFYKNEKLKITMLY